MPQLLWGCRGAVHLARAGERISSAGAVVWPPASSWHSTRGPSSPCACRGKALGCSECKALSPEQGGEQQQRQGDPGPVEHQTLQNTSMCAFLL